MANFDMIETDEFKACMADWTALIDEINAIERKLGLKPWQEIRIMRNPYGPGEEHDAFERCRAQTEDLWSQHREVEKRLNAARDRQLALNLARAKDASQ